MKTMTRIRPLYGKTAIAAALLLLAGAATANAFEVNKSGSGAEIKWGSGAASYFVNPAKGPAGSTAAILSGMQAWNAVPTADFTFSGAESGSGCTGSYTGQNGICFGPISQAGVVARNSMWYDPSTGEMIKSEIVFNTNYNWSIGGSPTTFDVQNIITHELGHSLSLKDQYQQKDAANTMYGYAGYGETGKRSLEADDVAGVSYLYPTAGGTGTTSTNNAPPTPAQSPGQCSYKLTVNKVKFEAAGGKGKVTVTAAKGCSWTAASKLAWVALSAPAAGAVTFSVAPNTTDAVRMGSITVAGTSITITQAANVITMKAAPAVLEFGAVDRKKNSTKSTVVTITGQNISSIDAWLGGSHPDSFPTTMTCARNSSTAYACTFTSTFKPVAVGARSATLDVSVNGQKAKKLSIPLKGIGR